MNVSIARTLADATRHPEQVIRRGEEYSTHLVYADEWQRFVTMRIYRREFFADAGVVRQFLERVESIQARYASGIAYPFQGGHENGRLYLLLQQLPGHQLTDLVQHRGLLDAQSLLDLGCLIAQRYDFVLQHYDLAPSLQPDEVCIHRDGGPQDWTAGFSGYDLRPVRQPWAVSRDTKAVQDLTLLLHYLRCGSLPASFEELLQTGGTPGPGQDPLARLFHRLLATNDEARPQTLAELRKMLEETAPEPAPEPDLTQPPVSRSLLHWIPDPSALTDRFQYGKRSTTLEFPSSFDAWDQLNDRASRVHILPPTHPDRPHLSATVQQCVRLAHHQDADDFTPVESAMSDPSCCLISESPSPDLSLWEVIKRRDRLELPEVLALLRVLAAKFDKLEQRGFVLPVLQPQNILLRPTGTPPTELWWKNLGDSAAFAFRIRPYPTNLLFTEAFNLSEIGGKGASRARATRNYFDPRFSLIALAHRLVRSAFHPDEKTPPSLAAVFHQAFSQSSAQPLSLLVPRLDKAIKVFLPFRAQTLAQPAGDSGHVPPARTRCRFSFGNLRLPLSAYPKSKAASSALLAVALFFPSAGSDLATPTLSEESSLRLGC